MMMMMMLHTNKHLRLLCSICETLQLGDPSQIKKSPENLKQHALSSALPVA